MLQACLERRHDTFDNGRQGRLGYPRGEGDGGGDGRSGSRSGKPVAAAAVGGKPGYPDDIRETPDTAKSLIEFDSYNLLWEHMIGCGVGPWQREHGVEFHGQVSSLKAALSFAAAPTTVSPTYAREILSPETGAGLDAYRDAGAWRGLQDRGMAQDFSWDASAARYEELFRELDAG